MNKTVTDITPKLQKDLRKLRVAAYARVSSDKDAMLHSLDAQIHYYRNLICGNPDWEFAGIYEDEAKNRHQRKSGTVSTACRNFWTFGVLTSPKKHD